MQKTDISVVVIDHHSGMSFLKILCLLFISVGNVFDRI